MIVIKHAWLGTIKLFLEIEPVKLLDDLCSFIYGQTYEQALITPADKSTPSQIRAWQNCIHDLKYQLQNSQNIDGYLIFEYEIPRSGGRRPDVLLLLPRELIVLEFKGYDKIKDAEKHQASLYVRDLSEYHTIVQKFHL